MNGLRKIFSILTLTLILAGCATPVPDDPELATIERTHLPTPDKTLRIAGLSNCTTNPDPTLHLNSSEPVTVIVHGCFGSAARFRALAQVFAFHGQQAVCFNYDDRDSLDKSADELRTALEQLNSAMENRSLTVIGHSQGGLITRRSLTDTGEFKWGGQPPAIHLVTISSPFAGIAAADHCASPTARAISLGLVIPICKLVSGDKWYEITRPSPFIQQPGDLIPQVHEHLKVVTDERDTCRRHSDDGVCIEDDFVFGVEEQYFGKVDAPPIVENIEVAAGHAEIVGDYRLAPRKLIALLQRNGVMHRTEVAQETGLEHLLNLLYEVP